MEIIACVHFYWERGRGRNDKIVYAGGIAQWQWNYKPAIIHIYWEISLSMKLISLGGFNNDVCLPINYDVTIISRLQCRNWGDCQGCRVHTLQIVRVLILLEKRFFTLLVKRLFSLLGKRESGEILAINVIVLSIFVFCCL